MAFELPALTYAYEALEPHIDAQTMHLHHDKHHQTYVDNANAAVAKAPELAGKTPEELLTNLAAVPEAVRTAIRNNVGGHFNHSIFWTLWRDRRGHQEHVRRPGAVPGEVQRCRPEAVWQRLGMAGTRPQRIAGAFHRQPG